MSLVLYELVGADGRPFSPNVWRSRWALAHKGLAFESRPLGFVELQTAGGDRFSTLPCLVDGARHIADSWKIACHLEEAYPDRPSLFGGSGGMSLSRLFQHWVEAHLHRHVAGPIVVDIWRHLRAEDQDYFRQSREERYGKSLEAVAASAEAEIDGFRASLTPLRRRLAEAPWLAGASPGYADYLVAGAFIWARSISDKALLAEDDPLRGWFARCLELYDGLGRKSPGYTTAWEPKP